MATVIQKTISLKGGQVELAAGTSYADDTAFRSAYDAAVSGLDAPGRVDHTDYIHEYVRTSHPVSTAQQVVDWHANGVLAVV